MGELAVGTRRAATIDRTAGVVIREREVRVAGNLQNWDLQFRL